MKMKNDTASALIEFGKCARLLSVWRIELKNMNWNAGRITVRYSRSGLTAHIAFELFPLKRGIHTLYAYERVKVYHRDCIADGIAKILKDNRNTLKQDYGIDIPADRDIWDVLARNWSTSIELGDIELGDYVAIRVI